MNKWSKNNGNNVCNRIKVKNVEEEEEKEERIYQRELFNVSAIEKPKIKKQEVKNFD